MRLVLIASNPQADAILRPLIPILLAHRSMLVYARVARFCRHIDCLLFDISKVELNYPQEVLAKQHLSLNALWDNHTTLEISDFLIAFNYYLEDILSFR